MPPKFNANIEECKAIAKQHDCQAVVVLRVERDGTINLSTYGESRHKCGVIGEWAQRTWQHIARIPFETVFGMGNGGVPKALEMREYMALTPPQKVYYDSIVPRKRKVKAAAE